MRAMRYKIVLTFNSVLSLESWPFLNWSGKHCHLVVQTCITSETCTGMILFFIPCSYIPIFFILHVLYVTNIYLF